MSLQNGYQPTRNLYLEGGGPYKGGPIPDQGSSKQGTQKQKIPVKTGMIGSMYPHVVGGMAPGGKGSPPDDKSDDESDEEENDESDTDEETVSVTSSSQVSAGKVKATKVE